MDDYKRAQRGQHNYQTKSNKSGERRAAFSRDTDGEVDDQMEDGSITELTPGQQEQLRASLPEIVVDGSANDKWHAENLRWQTYYLMVESLTTIQYLKRMVDRSKEPVSFAMFLDEVHEAFCNVPELREAVFWRRDSWGKKSARMYNLRMMVKSKIIDYVNANHAEQIRWIA